MSRIPTLAAVLLFAASGCAPLKHFGEAGSPLQQSKMSADSVVLELCSLRLTEAKALAAAGIWPEIDEQILEPETRKKLSENGFQFGTVGPHLPDELQKMIAAAEATPAEAVQNGAGENALGEKPRHKHFRSGRRYEFVTSDVQEVFPLLLKEENELRGRTFPKGQGMLAVKAFPHGDGTVRLELTPELHFGDETHQYRSDGEVILMQPGRRRQTLDQFRMDLSLSSGQILVLASRPDMPGSVGQRFFSEKTSTGPVLKMMLIRVAQTQHDDLFGESPDSKVD